MITPISLYHLERQSANDFITQTLRSFDWFIFLFYGGSLDKVPVSTENVPVLAELASQKIAVIDFLPTSDYTRSYLYRSWKQHCPSGVDSNLADLLQHTYELSTTNQEREALEHLFYTNIFCGDSFQPSLAVVNISLNYMIRRKFTYQHDRDLESFLIDFIEIIENEDEAKNHTSSHELGKLFNPRENSLYNPRIASRQNLEKAFANFLDSAEDALLALNLESKISKVEDLKINTTDKFIKAFYNLDKTIQDKAIVAIKKLA
ncbi:MAG: hypothetical protein F6K32_09290, partial [Desertifilum sp. SIO1I2]|nr:hypothetical protein [Desertifilum sp. SIO1I2]